MSELSREEIKQRLLELNDPWLIAAFAARVTALALPRLTVGIESNMPFLWFWQSDKREEYLLNTLKAWQGAWSATWFKDKELVIAISVKNATSAAEASSIDTVSHTVDTAARAAATARAVSITSVAADIAAYAVTVRNTATLINSLEKNQDTIEFLSYPFEYGLQKQQNIFMKELGTLKGNFDYWADWYEARLHGEPLDKNITYKSCLLSDEILSLPPSAINAYLKQVASGQTRALNRIRAIFIGHGAAGKTSLIRALHGETVEEGKEDMTPGVDIRPWPWVVKEGQIIQADLWDFGGQVVAHATHQFFLRSRCVYVLVLAGREEINANQQAEYWLEHIRTFGDNAPVLLVGNKADIEPVRLDLASLQQHYPNIINFYSLSCTHYRGDYHAHFQCFMQEFRKQLLQLNRKENVDFATAHFNVMQAIEAKSEQEAILPKYHFDDLCKANKINRNKGFTQAALLQLLDRLGIIIYFPQLRGKHKQTYVLNPHWLTYGVYGLIYAIQTREQKGYLHIDDVSSLLGSRNIEFQPDKKIPFPENFSYPPTKCDFIIEAMEHFKLCYRLSKNRLIIPARLPEENKAALQFDKTHALAYELEFTGFLPRHIMPSFIVERHHEIVDELMWQNGVQLRSANLKAHALVTANYHLRCLSLWINGHDAVHYFEVLLDTIMDLKKNMSHMQMTQCIVLNKKDAVNYPNTYGEGNTSKVSLDVLRYHQRKNHDSFPDKHGNEYHLQEVIHKMPKPAGNTYVNVGRDMVSSNVIANQGDNNTITANFNNNTQLQQQLKAAYQQLGNLEDLLEIEAGGEAGEKAVKELKVIRNALRILQQDEPPKDEQQDAYEKLDRFADRLKDGSSQLLKALDTLKKGGQAIEWLKTTMPPLVTAIANMLS